MAYARAGDEFRWPEGVIPYEISVDFTNDQAVAIRKAIGHWNRHSMMRLIQRAGHADFVTFVPAEDSCSSSVGRVGGAQNIGCDVGDGFSSGNVIHEIGHAAGFFHEQQRPDRDAFVSVVPANIEPGKESNFEVRMGGIILGPYDYGSIMHYPADAFSTGGDTIVAPPGSDIGQREGLSDRDLFGACLMYGAPHFVVAFEDDHDRPGTSDVMWAGITRWGSYCWRPVPVAGGGDGRALPNVAMDADRTSVVVWQQGGVDAEVHAHCLAVDGAERFDEITVGAGGGAHRAPDVAMTPGGEMVVAWQVATGGGHQEIRARGFARTGQERFAEITVADGAIGVPGAAAVAADAAGRFVVVWGDLVDESLSVRARGFGADGTERFATLTVAESLGDQDAFPRVAIASDGSFVVVYERGARDVRARGFNADGSERFAELPVSTVDVGAQLLADIAATPTGQFAVVWTDDRNENHLGQIGARTFDADGSEAVAEFAANPRGAGDQLRPRIGVDRQGRSYVTWEDDQDRNGVFQIHATVFDAAGDRALRTMTVNTSWSGQQRRPAIATR